MKIINKTNKKVKDLSSKLSTVKCKLKKRLHRKNNKIITDCLTPVSNLFKVMS